MDIQHTVTPLRSPRETPFARKLIIYDTHTAGELELYNFQFDYSSKCFQCFEFEYRKCHVDYFGWIRHWKTRDTLDEFREFSANWPATLLTDN